MTTEVAVEEDWLSYTGDTGPAVFDRQPRLLPPACWWSSAPSSATPCAAGARYKHLHLDDLAERAADFANEALVLCHLSRRHTEEECGVEVARRMPALAPRIHVFTGGGHERAAPHRRPPRRPRRGRGDGDRLIAGGEGFARYEGIPLFIPRSAPGDRLRVRLVERRPDYGRAEIIEVLAPGPGRREPPCPYFARCGGCDLQHLDDAVQARSKAAAVVETLVRLGGSSCRPSRRWSPAPPSATGCAPSSTPGVGIAPPDPVRHWASGSPAARGRRRRRRGRGGLLRPGQPRPRGGGPLPDPGAGAGGAAAGTAGRCFAAGDGGAPRRLDLAAGDGAVTAAPLVAGLPHGEVTLTVAGPAGVGELTYAYDARCFFQAHRELVGELVARAVGPWEGEEAYDLYAGVGLFSLPLARRYRRVVAVEGERVAARYARTNARRNRIANLEVAPQALESWIGRLPGRPARVVVDPPRGGLSRRVRSALFHARPQRLTYVSCHPATLARDLKGLRPAYRSGEPGAARPLPAVGAHGGGGAAGGGAEECRNRRRAARPPVRDRSPDRFTASVCGRGRSGVQSG